MERQLVSTGTEWEERVGYSRAVRAGTQVHVAGTTATDENGDVVGVGDPYAQTERALRNVDHALDEAGASLADVVRVRLFVVDIDDWPAVGDAHADVFGDSRPATTMVEVSRLVDPEMLVECEATAVVDG
ncbi:MAG: putative translation initiation inhibitor, yjgF family [uncultured archaeon A07HB70]|nr:MAG: putative translation initiation inhibitor, yjgF family [uncultured archaeon A07HB70]